MVQKSNTTWFLIGQVHEVSQQENEYRCCYIVNMQEMGVKNKSKNFKKNLLGQLYFSWERKMMMLDEL